MITSERQHDLVPNFNENDWIYGLDKPRAAAYHDLLVQMGVASPIIEDTKQNIVWRIDDINNQIIFSTVRDRKLTLNADIPEYLKKSANKFISYLKQYENSEEFIEVIDDEHVLTRYLCKQGIKYALSDDSGTNRIHFILDDIDLSKALIEVKNECFTASEIRELARNIEHPNMEHKIYFYRDGVKLAFSDFKAEMLKLMSEKADLIDINNSPSVKTTPKYEDDVKTQRGKLKARQERNIRKTAARILNLDFISSNADEPENLTATRRSLMKLFDSTIPITNDPLLNKLESFVFNPNQLSNSINELYLILADINIEDLRSNIDNSLLSQDAIKKSMLLLVNQFWALDLPRPATLQLTEVDENTISQQISASKDGYLFPIRHLLGKEFTLIDPSTADVAKLEKLIANIELICKAVFTDRSVSSGLFPPVPTLGFLHQAAKSSNEEPKRSGLSLSLPPQQSLFSGGGRKLF